MTSAQLGATGAAQSSDIASASSAATQAGEAAPSDAEAAVSVEVNTIPGEPPAEVHQAISVAAGSFQRLQASGRHMSFSLGQGSGALTVQLQDLSGKTVSTISVSEALRIAGGGNPELGADMSVSSTSSSGLLSRAAAQFLKRPVLGLDADQQRRRRQPPRS